MRGVEILRTEEKRRVGGREGGWEEKRRNEREGKEVLLNHEGKEEGKRRCWSSVHAQCPYLHVMRALSLLHHPPSASGSECFYRIELS